MLSLSWISAATGLVSFCLFLPMVFREKYIAQRELETLREGFIQFASAKV